MQTLHLDVEIAADIPDSIAQVNKITCSETGLDDNKLIESISCLIAEREVIQYTCTMTC